MRLALALAIAACDPSAPETPSPETSLVGTAPSAPARIATSPEASLVGTTPPEWHAERWLGSAPLSLASLRGSVVLVRWWTAGCPLCSTTAPALRALDADYHARGLHVIGMYHHKGSAPFDPAVYEETAKKYGFAFPVAVDADWKTLGAWMRGVDTGYTSVTFVLDKRGVVRHVHPGGSYVAGDAAYATLREVIERLLAET